MIQLICSSHSHAIPAGQKSSKSYSLGNHPLIVKILQPESLVTLLDVFCGVAEIRIATNTHSDLVGGEIRPNEVDAVISAEIPNIQVDPELHDIVTKNMIYGPCVTLNPNSLCMVDGKCLKRYPRTLISETITGNDGYPLYRRRSTADNGRSTIVKLNQQDIEVDNRWIVPYSPILSKTFKAHINVESCHSVKSIKYICKYVTKGSDMVVIGIGAENSNDEVTHYLMGRYFSSHEAMPRKRLRKTERARCDISNYEYAYEEVKRGTSLRRAAEIHEVNRMTLLRYIRKRDEARGIYCS
ncbi:uncharacterized protein [Atheta coriaria]|uniref:uncharacterized protein n=1 Tax=Dalotia coriaria TaxID=877792 RepID=UPI0031F36EB6